LTEGSGSEARSVQINYGSGCQEAQKHTDPDADPDLEQRQKQAEKSAVKTGTRVVSAAESLVKQDLLKTDDLDELKGCRLYCAEASWTMFIPPLPEHEGKIRHLIFSV